MIAGDCGHMWCRTSFRLHRWSKFKNNYKGINSLVNESCERSSLMKLAASPSSEAKISLCLWINFTLSIFCFKHFSNFFRSVKHVRTLSWTTKPSEKSCQDFSPRSTADWKRKHTLRLISNVSSHTCRICQMEKVSIDKGEVNHFLTFVFIF